jgi:divalent metal cation (Fe/Co/Zn/Cd) transporter
MSQAIEQLADIERARVVKRGEQLEYFTIAYNSLEGLTAIIFGALAGSIALISFGFDSVIEITSGAVLLWRLRAEMDEKRRESVEASSLRIIGVCFLALAAYVCYDAANSLMRREFPEHSVPGIVLAIASLVIMPLLARAKRRIAHDIKSAAMRADAKQTELCTYLSAILLGGLTLNMLLGWWWADPVAALLMVPIIAVEGYKALRGESCCERETCH